MFLIFIIYTYDAAGQRTVRYNYDRIDVSSNAGEVGQNVKDNVMLYPSGLIMGKAQKPVKKGVTPLVYTKHYYIGSERISAKTGTLVLFGDYPEALLQAKMPSLAAVAGTTMRAPSNARVVNANNTVKAIHITFGVPQPVLSSVVEPTVGFNTADNNTHVESMLNIYYFHPDHLAQIIIF